MISRKPQGKYVSAYGDARHLFMPPGAAAKLADSQIPIALVESEKASLALTAWATRIGMELTPLAMGAAGDGADSTSPSASRPMASTKTWPGRCLISITATAAPRTCCSTPTPPLIPMYFTRASCASVSAGAMCWSVSCHPLRTRTARTTTSLWPATKLWQWYSGPRSNREPRARYQHQRSSRSRPSRGRRKPPNCWRHVAPGCGDT